MERIAWKEREKGRRGKTRAKKKEKAMPLLLLAAAGCCWLLLAAGGCCCCWCCGWCCGCCCWRLLLLLPLPLLLLLLLLPNSPETDIFHFVLAADSAPDRKDRRWKKDRRWGSKITGKIEDQKMDPQHGPPSGLQNPFRPQFWPYVDIVSSMLFFQKRLAENKKHRRWGTKMVAEYLLLWRYVLYIYIYRVYIIFPDVGLAGVYI